MEHAATDYHGVFKFTKADGNPAYYFSKAQSLVMPWRLSEIKRKAAFKTKGFCMSILNHKVEYPSFGHDELEKVACSLEFVWL